MTEKTHQTAVVFTPPKECWPPIQVIREQHDSHVWRWMPHVTLLYPFRPRSQFDAVEKILKGSLETVQPFEVQLREFFHFHHGREQYTLWLFPEPVESVKKLQAALEQALPDCNDTSGYPQGFTPHLSVGQVQGKNRMRKLKAELQLSWKVLSFPVKEITLLQRGRAPADIFRVDRVIGLG
jgi:2'-5' RNA ligase